MAERRLPVAFALCTLAAACSQLLGIDDLGYHPDAGAPDAPGFDGIVLPDASPDASPDAGCTHNCLTTLYTSTTTLEAVLATDDTSIFFRTATQVLSCPGTQAPCTPALVRNTTSPPPRFLAAALDHVYWNERNAIYGCKTTSCSPTQFLDTTPAMLDGIGSAVHSSYLYAVDQDTTQNPAPIRVWMMGLDDLNPMPTQIINYTSGGPAAPNQVAAMPSSMTAFWSQLTSPTLYECSSGACVSTPSAEIPAGTGPLALVATPGQLYVATLYGVRSAPPTLTSAPAPFAGTNQALAIAANSESTSLFYADLTATNNVVVCPTNVTKCTPNVLAARTSAITAMAADETAVYWIEGGNTIMRLVP